MFDVDVGAVFANAENLAGSIDFGAARADGSFILFG